MSTPSKPLSPVRSETNRRHLASLVTKLFDAWQLDNASRLALLGLSSGNVSALAGYRDGRQPLPDASETLDRVGYLLAIHKGLRLLYPAEAGARYRWVLSPNTKLDGITPLSVMCRDLAGLVRIARYIDAECMR